MEILKKMRVGVFFRTQCRLHVAVSAQREAAAVGTALRPSICPVPTIYSKPECHRNKRAA